MLKSGNYVLKEIFQKEMYVENLGTIIYILEILTEKKEDSCEETEKFTTINVITIESIKNLKFKK